MKNIVAKVLFLIMLVMPFCVNAQEKTYKIGDVYDENGINGVVFSVTSGGHHGKIVSISDIASSVCWTSKNIYEDPTAIGGVCSDAELYVTEAIDNYDGKSNCAKILVKEAIIAKTKGEEYNYGMYFPAIGLFLQFGKDKDWYVPAIGELEEIFNARAQDDLDVAILKAGGTKFSSFYWSSTEIIEVAKAAVPTCSNCPAMPRRSPRCYVYNMVSGYNFAWKKHGVFYSVRMIHQF